MKIITKGNIQKSIKKYRFECRDCGCVFECEESEVKRVPGECNTTDTIYVCPTCKHTAYGKLIVYRD